MAAGPAIGGKRGAVQTVGVLNLLTDLAFNLLIFFVVMASNQAEQKGRPQQVPGTKEEKEQLSKEPPREINVSITRTSAALNGQVTDQFDQNDKPPAKLTLGAKLKELLANKSRPEERRVIVSHDKDTPYWWWIKVTGQIEAAGGVMTLVLESERKREVK